MRILIVEDEEAVAQSIQNTLVLKGFAVDHIADALKARTRILMYRNDYDLILLDLGLAGMSGLALTTLLREEGITTPIIIITGESDTASKVTLLNSGADDYVVKPFSPDELIARVNSVLRRPAIGKPVVHVMGDLEINTTTHSVRAGSVEIPLTLKEYSLFECFLRRPNEVLTREQLCNQVWDFNTMTLSNVLDVHMKNLRKKFSGHKTARFETVRGVGYRLVA
ncbi:MAG TPA: response regulator transcription factor [Candidatus Paceibacterota bacterium]|nr:response regulator transcription factor [Candidatus Paceibacterota bacterium]